MQHSYLETLASPEQVNQPEDLQAQTAVDSQTRPIKSHPRFHTADFPCSRSGHPHEDLVLGLLQQARADVGLARLGGQQAALIHQVVQLSAGEAGGGAGKRLCVHAAVHRFVLQTGTKVSRQGYGA